MTHRRLTLISLCLWLYGSAATAEQPLRIYASSSPPYQLLVGSDVQGTTVDTLRCALKDTEWRPDVRIVPQRRAIHSLERGLVDGYLAITQSSTISEFATLSAPLALEKWYLYSKEPVELANARLGAIAGSNEAIWLKDHGYSLTIQVSGLEQLIALMERDRIDAMLVDQQVMDALQEQTSTPPMVHNLQRQFIRFAPLGIYVGNNFTKAHPGFLNRFNDNLDNCVTSGFQLEADEISHVEQLAGELLNDLETRLDLMNNTGDQSRYHTLAEILMIDQIWGASSTWQLNEKAQELMDQPLSKALSNWQSRHNRVTETMVMDAKGGLVGLSQVTSDYWQGDEDKFRRAVTADDGILFVGPIRFDASAGHFQVFASRALRNPQSGELVGVVAIGIDIERALQGLQ